MIFPNETHNNNNKKRDEENFVKKSTVKNFEMVVGS